MSTETVEAPVEQDTGLDQIAHAYCNDQTLNFPAVPASGAKAWCGYVKHTQFVADGSLLDKCVVCVDLVENGTPCPHCGKSPW